MFGGGDRPISSWREPEEPKETVFLCTDTLLMWARLLENRDFGKGVTTDTVSVRHKGDQVGIRCLLTYLSTSSTTSPGTGASRIGRVGPAVLLT